MGEFLHRLNARLLFLFDAFGIVPFEAQLLKMHLSWIGHIARTDPYSVMYRIFFWRCTAWRDGQALADLRTKYKYFNVGHPPLPPDHVAQKNFGEFWPELASDRVLWASAVKEVIMPLIPPTLGSVPTLARLGLRVPLIAVLKPLQFGFLDYISNRHADMLFSSRMLGETKVQFFADSSVAVAAINGVAGCPDGCKMYLRHARWMLYAFKFRWRCLPVAPEETGLLVHCPREVNWFADWCCRYLRGDRYRDFVFWRCHEIDVNNIDGFVVTSDGSFDKSACVPAVCSACIQILTKLGVFEVVGFAAVKSTALDSLQAEFDGVLLAQRLFVQSIVRLGIVQTLESDIVANLDVYLGIKPLVM